MSFDILNRIGDWNPQLLRELKGRLKWRNIALVVGISLVAQLLVFLSFVNTMPSVPYSVTAQYCNYQKTYNAFQNQYYNLQNRYYGLSSKSPNIPPLTYPRPDAIANPVLQNQVSKPPKLSELEAILAELNDLTNRNCPVNEINFQKWWSDTWPHIFIWLGFFSFFTLLVTGSYMLISDVANEERRGTLNFIRLSPQSARDIFLGKILGVPSLLYLGILLVIPFHLKVGLAAGIPLVEILSFYAMIIGSCAFFYSASLLFSVTTSWLGGFQPWLGAGSIFVLLISLNNKSLSHSPGDWLNLFTPSVLLPYLVDRAGSEYTEFPLRHGAINELQWFYLPIGATGIILLCFALLNYGLWTYWIGQSLSRQFRSEQATIFSKKQSYVLTACITVISLGFALQPPPHWVSSQFLVNFKELLFFDLLLFLILIAALSPHRQTLQDWARYSHVKRSAMTQKRLIKKALFSTFLDLILGERSPSQVAIAINLAIIATPLIGWIFYWSVDFIYKREAILSLVLIVMFLCICTTLTQLMLLMKAKKRSLWSAIVLGSAIFLPPMILSILSIYGGKNGGSIWLITAFPWEAVKYATSLRILQAFLLQCVVLGGLNWQLMRQLNRLGESSSKALLAGRS